MERSDQMGLLTFTQNERFYILKRIRRNMNFQIVFIFIGLSIIFGKTDIFELILSNLLRDNEGRFDSNLISPIIPFVLLFQFISFGYLFGLFTKNAKVISLLVGNIIKSNEAVLTKTDQANIANMSGSYSFLQPYVSDLVFKSGGRYILKYIYNFLLLGFVFLNHFVTYMLIVNIIEDTNSEKITLFLTFGIYVIFFYHFFKSVNVEGSKAFVAVTSVIELIFVFWLLWSS